jgi:hypothetical protein
MPFAQIFAQIRTDSRGKKPVEFLGLGMKMVLVPKTFDRTFYAIIEIGYFHVHRHGATSTTFKPSAAHLVGKTCIKKVFKKASHMASL